MVYNFWQDDTHVRGLWRRTPEAEYAAENPEWETVLDFDKLASDEDSNWVFKGASVFRKSDSDPFVCLISLSDGGKDAVINREFDLQKKAFLDDGFITSEAKQDIAWIDTDTLLIGTDWGDDTVTESGYPFVLKRWKRGTPLADAEEVIRGDKTDVSMWPMTFELEDGRVLACAREANTFFTSTLWLLPEDGTDQCSGRCLRNARRKGFSKDNSSWRWSRIGHPTANRLILNPVISSPSNWIRFWKTTRSPRSPLFSVQTKPRQ